MARYRISRHGPLTKVSGFRMDHELGVPSAEEALQDLRGCGTLGPDDQVLVENGFKVCCAAVARNPDGTWHTCHAGSCTYQDDPKAVILVRQGCPAYGVRPWSVLAPQEQLEDEPEFYRDFSSFVLPESEEDFRWIREYFSQAPSEDVRAFYRMVAELKSTFQGALPPGIVWALTNISKWRKPRREAARQRRREATRAAEEAAWTRMVNFRGRKELDARLGDLAGWENFAAPRRWFY